MSGTLKIWNDGEAITTVELNRVAKVAASAEDRVWQLLTTPEYQGEGQYDKRVYPLLHEPPSGPYDYGRALVYQNVANNSVIVLPALYVVGDQGSSISEVCPTLLSAERLLPTEITAVQFPSSVTNGRTDTVYALVSRVATSEARKIKDPATGNVSTQTIQVYSTATVTFGTAQGPADASFTPPTLPADSPTAWYFPLANIKLDNGVGGAWASGYGIDQNRIKQTWSPGWIKRNRIQLAQAASIMNTPYVGGMNGRASTPLSDRWGASISVSAVLQHFSATPGVYTILDDGHDWSQRLGFITAWLPIPVGAANFTIPDGDGITHPKLGSSLRSFGPMPVLFGARGEGRILLGTWETSGVGTLNTIQFYMENDGALEVEFTDVPLGDSFPDPIPTYYIVMVEASDQFKF